MVIDKKNAPTHEKNLELREKNNPAHEKCKVAEAKNPQNSGALLSQSQGKEAENKSDSCILQHPIQMGNEKFLPKSQLLFFTSRRAPFLPQRARRARNERDNIGNISYLNACIQI